ncbi:type Z 30S ribosomal protein S14 [bacterium]|nr:type Z 30S ribosomal protein S14 [bacterium]
MTRKALLLKSQKKPKFSTRKVNRCAVCGRSRGYLSKFDLCRICFREKASKGEVPGITKSSW